jgi:Fungal chitosanase of glycosyl hydrolase group 75/Alpha-galactosidase, CBM13 domain
MRRRRILIAAAITAAFGAAVLVPLAAANAATASYEAEAAGNALAGGARVANCGGCSGGKRVGFVGNNKGTLQFTNVTGTGGSATVTIAYLNGSATRTGQLSVNGATPTRLSFAGTGTWNTVGTLPVTVTLKAGANTIKFFNDSGWAPDFDKITVDTGGAPPTTPPPTGGGGAPTAAELLAKVTSCNQISNGLYKTDSDVSTATVAVCDKNGAVFWKADMDVDCDGIRTAQCNENTDCCYQPDTAFHDSHDQPLNAAQLPYVVVPSESGIWKYHATSGIDGGAVVAVIYNNKVEYAVVGDTGPQKIIGEASYATANDLGINPDPSNGGTDSGVTYIVFKGAAAVVSPIESHGAAVVKGEALARQFVNNN